jgi:integrase/recombinase XerC
MPDLVRLDPAQGLPAPAAVDLLDAFLSGRNGRTLRAYDRDLADFAAFLGAADARAAVALLLAGGLGRANEVVLSYRAHLAARGLATATIARRLAALRSVVKLARTLGRVAWMLEIPSPKAEPFRDTAGPGDAGWRAVLERAKAEAAGGDPVGIRNLLVVRMLHDLGLRRGELAAVDRADVDAEDGTVAVVGKGRTEAIRLTMPGPGGAGGVAGDPRSRTRAAPGAPRPGESGTNRGLNSGVGFGYADPGHGRGNNARGLSDPCLDPPDQPHDLAADPGAQRQHPRRTP